MNQINTTVIATLGCVNLCTISQIKLHCVSGAFFYKFATLAELVQTVFKS